MSISLLLEMAVAADPESVAVVSGPTRWSRQQLSDLADGGAGVIAATGVQHVVYVGAGGALFPVLLFASARAARPFTPINYRLSARGIAGLIARVPSPLVIVDDRYREVIDRAGDLLVLCAEEFLSAAHSANRSENFADPEQVAVVLFTSGTTSAPKAVELSHNNLTSYITGTVEFGSAEATDAALICVPPYHIAGVSAALSNLYAGRKMVYLTDFDATQWLRLVEEEAITSATVVPTMLDRIVTALDAGSYDLSSLRTLTYGGSKVGIPLLRRALALLPQVGLANAYGLTETSSTIAVLTADDHRAALSSSNQTVAKRLSSVGKPVPGIELQIRDERGRAVEPGEFGELFVRGPQVSGKYSEIGSVLDEQGWFATKDIASVDKAGYLFISGRGDDTTIRGGENIAPAELEDVLLEHPSVRDAAVVGVEDPQWGQAIVAVVVPVAGCDPDPEELRAYVRKHLRGSRTPDRVVFRDALPTNATGKLLRRQIVADLEEVRVHGG